MTEQRGGLRLGGIVALVLVAAVVAAVAGVFPFRQILSQRQSVALAEAQLDALVAENLRLEQQVAALETPQEVERLAREQFGLVRPGEISFVAVVPEGTTEPAPEPVTPAFEERSHWWERLWDFLTGGDLVENG